MQPCRNVMWCLQNVIDFWIVPGLKEEFVTERNDLVLFWTKIVSVRFLALRKTAQQFLVLFGATWLRESGLSAMNHIKDALRMVDRQAI